MRLSEEVERDETTLAGIDGSFLPHFLSKKQLV